MIDVVVADSHGFARLQTARHDVDRDLAIETAIVGAVHLADPSGADRGADLVGTEACSSLERHERDRRNTLAVQGGRRGAIGHGALLAGRFGTVRGAAAIVPASARCAGESLV